MTRTELKDKLNKFSLAEWYNFYYKFKDYLNPDYVTFKDSIIKIENGIIVFEFRMNDYISFNSDLYNNDLLTILQIKNSTYEVTHLNITADPCYRKDDIAHACSQIYKGNVGWHRGNPLRTCIRSDNGLWYFRTDRQGNESQPDTYGCIGINIHNRNRLINSGLGCAILESHSEYQTIFKPILKNCANRNSIPVSIINEKFLE